MPRKQRLLQKALLATAFAAGMHLALAAPTGSAATDEERAAVARAAKHLDEWSGEPEDLRAARVELDAVLARNPGAAEAHFQYARYYINSAMVNGQSYDQDGLKRAEKSLDQAIKLSPSYAEPFVLRGSLYRQEKRPADAWASLRQARAMGSTSPWLPLNEAGLLLDEGRYAEALTTCRTAAKHAPSAKVLRAADQCMIDAHLDLGQVDEADAVHRELTRRFPDHAWLLGNYATFLLCTKGNPQAAIEHANSALHLMDYGMARQTLAAALYRDWADQVQAGRLAEAERAWTKATRYATVDPAQLMGNACGLRTALPVLYALRDTHRATLIAPMAAVLLAADAEDTGVPGVFGVDVVATGRDRGEIFLNSETDYRDQRNLTVHFTPAAAAAYRKLHGSDPDTALKGKRITVVGAARRMRIDFLHAGVPTGKFYYQTHVIVSDPAQVAIHDVDSDASPSPQPMPAAGADV